jgi:hypothetical protein
MGTNCKKLPCFDPAKYPKLKSKKCVTKKNTVNMDQSAKLVGLAGI